MSLHFSVGIYIDVTKPTSCVTRANSKAINARKTLQVAASRHSRSAREMSDDISNDDDATRIDESRLPPTYTSKSPSENEKANDDETSCDESDEIEAENDDYDYERKLKSMSESPDRKSNTENRSTAATGAALLRGGTITLSMSDDAVRIESNRAVDETPPPPPPPSTLAAVFAPSLSPPPSDASAHVAMLSLSNDGDCGNGGDDPDAYNWDELGRMMSGGAAGAGAGGRVGRRTLARSASEVVFQARNTETNTVTLTKSKKGYGFQIRGDGPVWISGVDKGGCLLFFCRRWQPTASRRIPSGGFRSQRGWALDRSEWQERGGR